MDRDTHAMLYRTNVPEADSMSMDGRIEDLVRAFKVLPKTTQREYSITVGEVKYGLDHINNFAREFGIKDQAHLDHRSNDQGCLGQTGSVLASASWMRWAADLRRPNPAVNYARSTDGRRTRSRGKRTARFSSRFDWPGVEVSNS